MRCSIRFGNGVRPLLTDPDIVQEVLRGGIEQTRAVGGETMDHVRAAMYIDYPKLLAPQAVTS